MRNFFLVFLIIFSGCNITKKANNSSTIKKIPTKRLLENVEKNKSDFTYLLLRSQATVIENGSKSQFNVSIRIKKDDKILISGSLLIPLFKGLFTENKLMFYEKLNKSYYEGNFQYVSELFNFEFTLESVQNLLTGEPLTFKNSKLTQALKNSEYELESYDRKKKVSKSYTFNPINFNLKKQSFSNNLGAKLSVVYDNYKTLGEVNVPQLITILATNKDKTTRVVIKSKISRINQEVTFPFKIPSGYKKIKL